VYLSKYQKELNALIFSLTFYFYSWEREKRKKKPLEIKGPGVGFAKGSFYAP